MADKNKYEVFQLLNKEFTFNIDVSNLPCSLNGALYFTEMDADGGLSKYSGSKAGAKYGTGYCDAQCAHDLKFIGGEANVAGWTPSTSDSNSGTGNWGACCHEVDIWEANSISAAFTPHPCTKDGLFHCTGIDCHVGNRYGGVCDADGCDFNSYSMGAKDFFSPGKTVDSMKMMTVITQFITDDNTSTGTLKEIRCVYVQDGNVIQNSKVNIPELSTEYDSLTDQKTIFGDADDFSKKGGLAAINKSLARGGILVMSTWDDYDANMLWLDSSYPTTKNSSAPGVACGTCSTDSGVPADVEAASPNSSVTFSNIRQLPPLKASPVASGIEDPKLDSLIVSLPFSVCVACSPYTPDANLLYKPWRYFLQNIKTSKPEVVILLGPFIDSTHPKIKTGDVDSAPAQLFKAHILAPLCSFFDSSPNSISVIVPSICDLMSHHAMFPQSEFDGSIFNNDPRIRLLPNPGRFSINDISFAATSVEIQALPDTPTLTYNLSAGEMSSDGIVPGCHSGSSGTHSPLASTPYVVVTIPRSHCFNPIAAPVTRTSVRSQSNNEDDDFQPSENAGSVVRPFASSTLNQSKRNVTSSGMGMLASRIPPPLQTRIPAKFLCSIRIRYLDTIKEQLKTRLKSTEVASECHRAPLLITSRSRG
ncbi:glycosyl hydrolase family 7-domain-containing protein [Cyathus striatus]|nr:glycosyl hydrolase family 7-domain-containing protein [Cyathus striatus]